MLRQRHSTSRGFTLIECLAALVLVGIVLPVGLRGVTLAMQASGRARHLAEATEFAHYKLNEITLQGDTSLFSGNGEIDINGTIYRWTSAAISRDFGLYEVAVEVTWTSAGNPQSTQVATLVNPATTTSTAYTTTGGTP